MLHEMLLAVNEKLCRLSRLAAELQYVSIPVASSHEIRAGVELNSSAGTVNLAAPHPGHL